MTGGIPDSAPDLVTHTCHRVLEASAQGIRAVKISMVMLLVVTGMQARIVAASGSVALLTETIHHASDILTLVAVAGVVGFVGNELVARHCLRIGSALIADGVHARTDGFISLAIVLSAAAVALGFPWADAIIGLVMAGMIVTLDRPGALPLADVELIRARAEAVIREQVPRLQLLTIACRPEQEAG